MKRAILR